MIDVVIITQSFSCVSVQFLVLHTIAEIILTKIPSLQYYIVFTLATMALSSDP